MTAPAPEDTHGGPLPVQRELARIYEEHGQLTPPDIVDAAADEASPLHSHFEWDDTEAARLHRLNQARALVQRFRIWTDQEETRSVRAWVNVITNGDGHSYRPVAEVLTQDILREQHRRRLRAQMRRLANELQAFEEYGTLAADLLAAAS